MDPVKLPYDTGIDVGALPSRIKIQKIKTHKSKSKSKATRKLLLTARRRVGAKPFVAVIIRRAVVVVDAGAFRLGAVEEASGDLLRFLLGDLDFVHRRGDAVVGGRGRSGGGIWRRGWDRAEGEAGGPSGWRRRGGFVVVLAFVGVRVGGGVVRFVGHVCLSDFFERNPKG